MKVLQRDPDISANTVGDEELEAMLRADAQANMANKKPGPGGPVNPAMGQGQRPGPGGQNQMGQPNQGGHPN